MGTGSGTGSILQAKLIGIFSPLVSINFPLKTNFHTPLSRLIGIDVSTSNHYLSGLA